MNINTGWSPGAFASVGFFAELEENWSYNKRMARLPIREIGYRAEVTYGANEFFDCSENGRLFCEEKEDLGDEQGTLWTSMIGSKCVEHLVTLEFNQRALKCDPLEGRLFFVGKGKAPNQEVVKELFGDDETNHWIKKVDLTTKICSNILNLENVGSDLLECSKSYQEVLFYCSANTIQFLDARERKRAQILGSHRIDTKISHLALSPHNPNSLASAGEDNYMHIWDLRKAKKAFKTFQHKVPVTTVSWNPNKEFYLATAAGKGISFFNSLAHNFETPIAESDMKFNISTLIFNERGNELFIGYKDMSGPNLWAINQIFDESYWDKKKPYPNLSLRKIHDFDVDRQFIIKGMAILDNTTVVTQHNKVLPGQVTNLNVWKPWNKLSLKRIKLQG